MKNTVFFLLLILSGCERPVSLHPASTDSTVVKSNDTVPEIRKSVQPNAIASFTEPVKDLLNNWKFTVSVYQTEKTFSFLVRMQYKELRAAESFRIPNFGIQPKIEIRKGKEPLSCLIGFYDKKDLFREYIKVSIKGEQLKFTRVNSYFVGAYRTKT